MMKKFFRGLVEAREMELRNERIHSRAAHSKKEQKDR